MPKVVMINTVLSGSHGRIMRDIRDAIQPDGWETTLAYGRGRPAQADEIRIDSKLDILAHVALTRTMDRHAKGSARATKQLIERIDAIQPDLIHLHNVHGYYLHAPILFDYLRKKSLPTVWTQHDCWAFTGHCSHFVRADCDRWQSGCHDCPLRAAYPTSWHTDASKANWHWKRASFASLPSLHIVAPSRWLGQMLSQSFLQDIPRQVIENGIDLSLFSPGDPGDAKAVRARYGVAQDQLFLLCVASPFDERKGIGDILRIAQDQAGKATVLLVGLTEKQCKQLPPNVRGIPPTAGPEDLVALYRAADCLLNATREDTYPTVNMEAMACGTPVACYSVGGATEQLSGPGGIPVPVGNIAALTQAALSLARDKANLTDACHLHAQTSFDRQAALTAYRKLYQTILGV